MRAAEDFVGSATRLAGQAMLLFGWRPAEFWAATPADLEMALRALAGADAPDAGLDSAALTMMMEAFPDG